MSWKTAVTWDDQGFYRLGTKDTNGVEVRLFLTEQLLIDAEEDIYKQIVLKLRRRIALFLIESKIARPVIDKIIEWPLPDYKILRWFVSGFGLTIALRGIVDHEFTAALLTMIIIGFIWLLPDSNDRPDGNDENDDCDEPDDPDMPNGDAVDKWLRGQRKAKRDKV